MNSLPHAIYIAFTFALGACVGSFLNVVVWRLPRGQSLSHPGSRCPKCGHGLAWRDNIPVLGWLFLGGKCRYCKAGISARYPLVEAFTGLLFVFYYVMFFVYSIGPCAAQPRLIAVQDQHFREVLLAAPLTIEVLWPIFALYLFLLAGLLAASLIDAELFIIPISIPWWAAGVGVVVHTIFDRPTLPGALNASPPIMAMSAGAALGLILSIILLQRKILPLSFAEGGPLMEHEKAALAKDSANKLDSGAAIDAPPSDFTPRQIRTEIRKEMLFLMPPMVLGGIGGALAIFLPSVRAIVADWSQYHWLTGCLGALWGALIGGFTVWMTRILGSYAFGKEAMGLGDVHLMFGVGAVIGAGASVVAFFLAPFFGILFAIYTLLTGRRQLPYGPYLSLATAFVLLTYCPIAEYFAQGGEGLKFLVMQWTGRGQ